MPFVEKGSFDGVPGRLSPVGPIKEQRPLRGAVGPGTKAIQPGPVVRKTPGAHGKDLGLVKDEIEISSVGISHNTVALLPIAGAEVIRYVHLGDHDTQAQVSNFTQEGPQFRMVAGLLQRGEVGLDAQTVDGCFLGQFPLKQSKHPTTFPLSRR